MASTKLGTLWKLPRRMRFWVRWANHRSMRFSQELEVGVAVQPRLHPRRLVGAVIVDDDVQIQPRRGLLIDGFQKADEFLMTMAGHTVADHLAVQNIEGGEQGGGVVTLVIVGEGAATARLHRQSRLGAIQGLNLAFFIDAQHQGFFRRIQVQSHDILQFLDELRVPAELEGFRQMRFEVVLLPNPAHRGFAQALRPGHGPRTPVGGIGRLRMQRRLHHQPHFLWRDTRPGVRAEERPFPVRPAEAPRNAAATVAPWDEKYPIPRRYLGSVCLGLPGEQSAPAAPAAPGYFALATTSPRWTLPQGSTQWMLHVCSCRTA